MPVAATSVICDAIRRRELLRVTTAEGVRVVEPYIHGFGDGGSELLFGYQVDGPSKSGVSAGWKTLRLSAIEDIERLHVVPLRAQDEYAGRARGFRSVHCQV
jgi:hypothetical protein